ncbi:MAG TPA: hypothetical protein VLH35_08100 [Candidatus Acidoferrales bacterium]|nr:hypothetical protein [Candidatus Acidoferrales bacterium]
MKSTCPVCGQSYRGIALNTVKDGQAVEVCPACYKTLDAEYRKNSCLACVFFHSGACELFGTELDEPYVQNAKCGFFTTSTDESVVAKAKIKKYEMSGRFEDAAREYEKLGMAAEAEGARSKSSQKSDQVLSLDEAVEQLTVRGQTLTYFCCHCGAPLKVGTDHAALKSCSKCKYDLSALDLAKLISQHL